MPKTEGVKHNTMNLTEVAIIFTPLTFLPGIGMLIMSTSRRYIELINQMQRVFQQEQKYTAHFISCQKQRLGMFKWVQTLLYLCVGLILLGSLLGGLTVSIHPLSEYLLFSFYEFFLSNVFLIFSEIISNSLASSFSFACLKSIS